MTRSAAPLPELGAPGVYLAPDVVLAPPAGVRMDVCAFAGVAPRGSAWERLDDPALDPAVLPGGRARSVAVPVQSWSEYEDLFGGHAGPGLLPAAVAAFFAQGGVRAYVVRVVPRGPVPDPEPPACTRLVLDTVSTVDNRPVRLRARNEGSWGDRLTVRLAFAAAPLPVPDAGIAVLPRGVAVPVGTLLRLRDTAGTLSLHAVTAVDWRAGTGGWDRSVTFDRPVTGPVGTADVITATLEVVDADPDRARTERFAGLGLLDSHPRWVGRVLADESRLVEIADGITEIRPGTELSAAMSTVDVPGVDRYAALTPDDMFGTEPPDAVAAPAGLEALRDLQDCASLCVPDLYKPERPPPAEEVGVPATMAGAGFAECVTVPSVPSEPSDVDLPGLRLDPALAEERKRITLLQQRVAGVAERLGLVALLDVPPGLRPEQVLAWRAAFDTSYAAAYHGWPRVPGPNGLAEVPPSAYAAGVLAATERAAGLARGPALVPLVGAVGVLDGPGAGAALPDPRVLGALHGAGINVTARDGLPRFTAARTLSVNPAWRQLTARRVVSQLERTLAIALGWACFEPNGPALRERVRVAVEHLLGELFAGGAFAGGTPGDAFFVRIPKPETAGEATLLCEIGVAPSAPLEFIVLRIVRADDGTVAAEVQR